MLQKIAAEMNLSETAFVVRRGGASFDLRWFTPTTEVPLCGHATLAAAAVLLYHNGDSTISTITFKTKSGDLVCRRGGDGCKVRMNFPLADRTNAREDCEVSKRIVNLLNVEGRVRQIQYSPQTKKLLVETDLTRQELKHLSPNVRDMLRVQQDGTKDIRGVIVTTRSKNSSVHFHSRYFAPWVGIDEDPVTGSAHTVLGPFWGRKLGLQRMTAEQCSPRGGTLALVLDRTAGRIDITGDTSLVLRGEIFIQNRRESGSALRSSL